MIRSRNISEIAEIIWDKCSIYLVAGQLQPFWGLLLILEAYFRCPEMRWRQWWEWTYFNEHDSIGSQPCTRFQIPLSLSDPSICHSPSPPTLSSPPPSVVTIQLLLDYGRNRVILVRPQNTWIWEKKQQSSLLFLLYSRHWLFFSLSIFFCFFL